MKYYDKTLAIFLFINLNVTCCQSYFSYLLLLMLDPLGPIFERIRRSQTDRAHAADSLPHETRGPRAWLVYSRRGNKGKSG
jgi:hypothetical protein